MSQLLARWKNDPLGVGLAAAMICVHCFWGVLLMASADGVVDWLSQWSFRPTDALALVELGALNKVGFWLDAEYWRALSSFFVHGSLLHLALNLSALLSLSMVGERYFGRLVCLTGLLTCAVVGGVASALWGEGSVSVGASGGIFGLGSAIWVLSLNAPRWGRGDVEPEFSANRLGIALLASLAIGWGVTWLDLGFRIDQAGHLGGMALGLVWGVIWRFGARVRVTAAVLSLAALGFTWAAVVPLIGVRAPSVTLDLGVGMVERGDLVTGVRLIETSRLQVADPVILNDAAYRLTLAGHGFSVAELMVRRALVDVPEDPNFLDTLGWLLCISGRSVEGLAQLEDAVSGFDPVPEEVASHLRDCPR